METLIANPISNLSHTNRSESSNIRSPGRDLRTETDEVLRDLAYVFQLSRRLSQEIKSARSM